ncbi:MAG: YggT family protein [Microgenomates group bacterium]|jgi:uncharacterized protein YggT (Ycf19 family)
MPDTETTKEVTTVSESAPVEVTETTKTVTPPAVNPESPQKAYAQKKTIFRTYQVIWYILGVIEVLLTFRVVLKMLGADISSTFVSLLYTITDPLALPFRGIFAISADQGAILEWSTFVAMIVYALIGYALVQLMQLIKPTTPQEVEEKVDTQ